MRYRFIDKHRRVWPIVIMCKVLQVSRSGFYGWRRRPPSEQAKRRCALTVKIKSVHEQSRQTYGSPRVHRELLAQGQECSENTVARIMAQNSMKSRIKHKFKATTDSNHDHPVADNLLNRNFEQTDVNQTWASDITYISTHEGWLYLAIVIDLFSRMIVGWSMSSRINAQLTIDALEMAIARRCPGQGLLHHSDRGSQYACKDYQQLLKRHSMIASMSRKGDCYDNASAESVFGTIKTEWVNWQDYLTRQQGRESLFEYMEVFYNCQRRHSSLNYMSPKDFEAAAKVAVVQ